MKTFHRSPVSQSLRRQAASRIKTMRDRVEDALDASLRRMDASIDIARRVADLPPDMSFHQALSQVLGIDIELIRVRSEEMKRSRELILAQFLPSVPFTNYEEPRDLPPCPVCVEFGHPTSAVSRDAHRKHVQLPGTSDLANQIKMQAMSESVQKCIRDNMSDNLVDRINTLNVNDDSLVYHMDTLCVDDPME